jgi:hypothetical protein
MTARDPAMADGAFARLVIRSVVDRAIAVYRHNFLPFTLISLTAFSPLLVVASVLLISPRGLAGASTSLYFGVEFATILLFLFSQAILVHASFQFLHGREVNLLQSGRAALYRFIPIIGIALFALVAFLVVFVGLTLLAISVSFGSSEFFVRRGFAALSVIVMIAELIAIFALTVMLAVRWCVAVPVCMVERAGPWRSLRRSMRLTKGYQWKIFGIVLLLFAGFVAVDNLFATVLWAIGDVAMRYVVSAIWYAVWGAFLAVFLGVTYYELRRVKEGVNLEQIVSVFD